MLNWVVKRSFLLLESLQKADIIFTTSQTITDPFNEVYISHGLGKVRRSRVDSRYRPKFFDQVVH